MEVTCLLYTSDAADEEDSGDPGGRRIIKKKKDKTAKETGISIYERTHRPHSKTRAVRRGDER